LKAYIKIARISLPILINTGASVCIISKDLAKKLKLKVKANNKTKIVLLSEGSKFKVIGLIPNASITV